MKKYLALKASAGSGKTFALTVRYISLLLLGAKPNEILTLTFTNKAANEMSERIYKTLLSLGEDESYLSAIMRESNLSKEEILIKKSELINFYSTQNLSIFTLDKFINKILREFCGYIGISDDFEIKQDDEELLSINFLKSLDLEEFKILIDFSFYENKKFNSIFELFKNLLEKNENIEIVDINSSLITLQKNEVLKEAFKIKEFILNCPVASDAVKKAVDFNNFEELFEKSWLEKNSLTQHNYFKKCANETVDSYFFKLKEKITIYYKLRAGYSLGKLFKLYKLFKDFKLEFNKNKNYLEFNDVSNLVYELLSTKIDKDFLYFRLDSNYSHILIDEFQDTSILQYKILEPLINEILSGDETKFKTFFYVGDIKQSIYRFRGGKRELFDYVSKVNKTIDVEVLNINYRSCENIINFVNDVFSKLEIYEYYSQESINKNGYVEVIEDDKLQGDDKFENIALKIDELLNLGIKEDDIAILTYTNDDVLSLYNFLKQKFPNLKISTEMTSKLINQINVKAIINALKYLYFKEDIYKENLNSIMGKNFLSEFPIDLDLQNKSVQEIVKIVATNLKLIDENVIKFINDCKKYMNIVDFIYEVDKLESSIQNSQNNGLQILTIFKSKGLEFHTVILLDRLKKKNPDRSTLLFDFEDINLKNIFYKIKGFENYDDLYSKALLKEKSLVIQDELNILYVAMTRAKKNMIIFKKSKSSVFEYLNLKVFKIGELIKSEKLLKTNIQNELIDYKPLHLGTQDRQISSNKDLDAELLHSKYFGIASHYCLEMMNEFTKKELETSILLTKSRFSNFLSQKDFFDIEFRIESLIKDRFFSSLVDNSIFSTEQSIMYKGEIKILDLLVFKNAKYYIIDYKTTKQEEQEHLNQVRYYKRAIKDIFNTQEVFAYLIYLRVDELLIQEVI